MMKRIVLAAALVASQAPVVVSASPAFRAQLRDSVTRAAQLNLLVHRAKTQRRASRFGHVAKLISSAHGESDIALHKMTVMSLLTQKMPLLRTQKKAILQMVRDSQRGLLPKHPPIPKTGTIEARHYSMRGFLDADLQKMRDSGFTITRTGGVIEARRGRMHVIVKETHEDILRDLNDPKVNMILYNGHSQIGGVVEQALQQAALNPTAGRKLVVLLQCVGVQTMPMLKGHAPNIDVITSKVPLYVSETPVLAKAIYDGIDKGEGYHRLRRRLDNVAWGKGRLVFPNQTATLAHTDYDINGVLDANQAGGIQMLSRADGKAAQSLMSGVHFLRTMNPYYADQTPGAIFGREQARVPVIARGIVQDANAQRVTKVVEQNVGGKRSFEVALNSRFKGASPELVGAASVFELQMHLQATLVNHNDQRAKVRALAFAGEYLELIPRNARSAQTALDELTKMNGLPKLSLWDVKAAIAGDHVIGEPQVDRLEAVVNRAALAQPR